MGRQQLRDWSSPDIGHGQAAGDRTVRFKPWSWANSRQRTGRLAMKQENRSILYLFFTRQGSWQKDTALAPSKTGA